MARKAAANANGRRLATRQSLNGEVAKALAELRALSASTANSSAGRTPAP